MKSILITEKELICEEELNISDAIPLLLASIKSIVEAHPEAKQGVVDCIQVLLKTINNIGEN